MAVRESIISRFVSLLDFGAEVFIVNFKIWYPPNLRDSRVPDSDHVTLKIWCSFLLLFVSLHLIFIKTYVIQMTLIQFILFIYEY
jgi:hypothetical protein